MKSRTNYKTLTLIALKPEQVNIEHTITSGNFIYCRQVYILRSCYLIYHTIPLATGVGAEKCCLLRRQVRAKEIIALNQFFLVKESKIDSRNFTHYSYNLGLLQGNK